jgi:ABC-type antimicrobial peptide transport system permease subunit
MGAALLAAVGIYGVTSHVIVTRFRELGLRRALGASHRQLIGQAVRSTVADVGIGIAVGLVLAWIGRQAVSGLLFGVEAGSPVVWGGACLVFIAVAAVASWLPARRVARVDPATVLKGS